MEQKPVIAKCEPTCIKTEPGKTYAWCTCGLSEKQPFCDGKHKTLWYEENGETVMTFKSQKVQFEDGQEVWFCNCKHTKTPPFCDGTHRTLQQDLPANIEP